MNSNGHATGLSCAIIMEGIEKIQKDAANAGSFRKSNILDAPRAYLLPLGFHSKSCQLDIQLESHSYHLPLPLRSALVQQGSKVDEGGRVS